ncbi:MAG: type II toxin-antitoxin system RelE family toxin [Candidatus Methylomirabilia bacterium]
MPTWRIEVKPTAEKRFLRLDKVTRRRILAAMLELEELENPLLHTQVRALTGELHGDYRLRVGGWRVLFTPNSEERFLYVFAIVPRGEAYR